MALISFGGVASGIDTQSIVAQMVALRRRPIQALETQKTDIKHGLSILNDIRDNLIKLQDAAKNLDTAGEFAAKSATSATDTVLTATASSPSPLGTFSVVVTNLAETHRLGSAAYTAATDSVGTGTFSITVGATTTDIALSSGAESLADLKTAINDADAGVTASIMNDGTGYRLLLSSDETGSAGVFTVDASGLSGGTAPTFTTQSTGIDANFTIDGIAITSSSNTVTDALEGVTFDLKTSGTTNVTIATNADDLAANLEKFASAYNTVVDAIKAQSEKGAPLNGNSLLRSVQSRLASTMATAVETGGDFRTTGEVGLSLDRDGRLSVDKTKLTAALESDFASTVDLFVQGTSTTGVAASLVASIDGMTNFADGLFRARNDSMNDELSRIDKSIERKERSLDSYETVLNRKFTAMELAISQLQRQSGGLFSF
jgi:flagellar hook-associated protein 2